MSLIRRRFFSLAALALAIALGRSSRAWPVGWYPWDKSLGDVLYAVAAYLVLRLFGPRLHVITAAVLALAFCLGIEAFKFTGIPAAWAAWRVSRLVFGTTPSWHNVLCYVLAIATVAALEAQARRGLTSTR